MAELTALRVGRLAAKPRIARAAGEGPGDPRVNIQNDHGKAKAYQVLAAIEKKEASS